MPEENVKVRTNYPTLIKIVGLLILAPAFFSLSRWVLGGALPAYILTSLLVLVTLSITLCGMIPMKVKGGLICHMNTRWRAHKVTEVKSKTVEGKFLHGVTSTTVTFKFKDTHHVLVLTDTRYPMFPTSSGYSNQEADALIEWLSQVPENVDGYKSVIHLKEMLEIKKTPEKND